MLEGQNYKNVDVIFLFLAGFLDKCIGWVKETSLAIVHVLYSVLLMSMTNDEVSERWNENKLI